MRYDVVTDSISVIDRNGKPCLKAVALVIRVGSIAWRLSLLGAEFSTS
jgi:hypothetical protein